MVKIDSVIHTNLQKNYSVICILALSSSHDSTNFTLAPAWLSHFGKFQFFQRAEISARFPFIWWWRINNLRPPRCRDPFWKIRHRDFRIWAVQPSVSPVALLRYICKYHCKVTDHDQQEEREFWQMRYPISPPLCRYISLWIVVFPHDNDLSQTFVLGSHV